MYPEDRKYSKDHEWIVEDGDTYTVGITEFAQSELGDVVFVELPEVGEQVDANDELGSIESVKAVAEVYTPVSGEIVAVNEVLTDAPEKVNDDPHGDGWLVKMTLSAPDELDGLMTSAEYEEFIQEG